MLCFGYENLIKVASILIAIEESMNQESVTSFSSNKNNLPVKSDANIDAFLDEFNISEDSFKPMTKGLGFHQDKKRNTFSTVSTKETKVFTSAKVGLKSNGLLNTISDKTASALSNNSPSGLEAFYVTKGNPGLPQIPQGFEEKKLDLSDLHSEKISSIQAAPVGLQLAAWVIDLLVIASFVAVTGALLVIASGIQFKMFARLISQNDFLMFGSAIFSIYYLLYFTILDLTASPGKTIFGLRLLKSNNRNVTVKNTFTRSFISLLSAVALFLPMVLDFQGRLSDTKLIK